MYLYLPAGTTQAVGESGTVYLADSVGRVNAANNDVIGLLNGGCSFMPTTVSGLLSGTQIALTSGKNADGSGLTATAASGGFATALTAGTSEALDGEAAKGNTKTDTVYFEHVLPNSYVEGQNITVTVNAALTGTGTAGTHTLTGHAYLLANNGTMSTDLVTTAAANITAAGADMSFTIPGATLVPGARVLIGVTTAVQETGGANNLGSVLNSVRLS